MAETFIDAEHSSPTMTGARQDDCQMVAVFNTNNGAHLARAALLAAGLPPTSIHVIDRVEPQPAGVRSLPNDRRAALLNTIGSLFARSESAAKFHLADDPNHALLVLDRGSSVDRARARQILAASKPIEVYSCI